MHTGKPLSIVPFDSEQNPLKKLSSSPQLDYLNAYLNGAGVQSVIVEHNYFDRDYLDEFSAFYSKSAKGYTNICKRIHLFSDSVTTRLFNSALGGQSRSERKLQSAYLGFIILRPLVVAPFGRTVLAWYQNRDQHSIRITPELRSYTCNILGVELSVKGIPWQQQDRGVSACATIALWSMFHSSAFDANHSVPTTVEITNNAHNGSSGRRAFPSTGLSVSELQEAIFSQKLTPKLLGSTHEGTSPNGGKIKGFSVSYMASMCAANIRSSYPVLFIGEYVHTQAVQQHAICCIGFREKEQSAKAPGTSSTMDDETEVFYIHDDNIGPNVRCRLIEENGLAVLETEAPAYVNTALAHPQPANKVKFRPSMMLIAVHNEIRMDAEALVKQGAGIADAILNVLGQAYKNTGLAAPAISYNTQFLTARRFFSGYLAHIFEADGKLLRKVRRSLGQDAPPLCLHIGLVSIGLVVGNMSRVIDVLYDTTDSVMNNQVIAHIIYDSKLKDFFDRLPPDAVKSIFGTQIIGFDK
jgi:hypothetical protein